MIELTISPKVLPLSAIQPRLQSIHIYPVCDLVSVASANRESGHFLVLATGWDKQRWINMILFHAHLVDREVIIEEDNFEEGLTSALIQSGIDTANIRTSTIKQNISVESIV